MRLQTSSAGLAIGDADNRYLRLAGGTMTGELNALAGLNTVRPYSSGLVPAGLSDPAPAFPFETQWNNAGKNWTAVRVSVTNTASGSGSKLADFQVGGVSQVAIKPASGAVTGSVQIGGFRIDSIYGTLSCSQAGSGAGQNDGVFYSGQVRATAGFFSDSFLEIFQIATPAAPATSKCRLYCDQSGGKNRLMVLFPTGAAQVLATEP